jgi:hypothetical protein
MLVIVLPKTNPNPDWIEIRVDDVHMGRIWGTVTEITLEPAVNQFMVVVETDHLVAYLWADKVQAWADPVTPASLLRAIAPQPV